MGNIQENEPKTSKFSVIDCVPSEILIEIFVFSARDDPLAPLALTRVNRQFQDILAVSPRIWQLISLSDKRSLQSSYLQALLFMRQSSPLTFDVHLDISEDTDLILPLLSPLLSQIRRWRHFSVSGKRQESTVFTPAMTNGEKYPLYQLELLIVGTESAHDSGEEASRSTFITKSSLLPPNTLGMESFLTYLPSPTLFAPFHFTTLTLTERSLGMHTQPLAILNFLTAFPQLEAFHFRGWKADDQPIDSPLPIVDLPHLHTLDVCSTCSTRPLLSSLYVPRLERLYLSDINIDFTLRSEYNELGDSDDESGDFSQSPWSDRATGMGLRKLMSRSNPPLRVLEMHYSDFRTKDFRYLFERSFSRLEEFVIVASDMSDNVMNLLRPYTPTARPGHDPAQNSTRRRLRLPRLHRLELYNCQRLSGEAIVETLAERSSYVERQTSSRCAALRDVAIVECAKFSTRHGQMLSKELRKKCKLRLE